MKWEKIGRTYVAKVPAGAEARISPSNTRQWRTASGQLKPVWEIRINGYMLAASDSPTVADAKTVVENLVKSGARWPRLT